MKKSTIFLVLALVAVVVLATVGYNALKDRLHRDSLSILGGTRPTETTSPTGTAEPSQPEGTEPEMTDPTQPEETTEPVLQLAPDFRVLDQAGNYVALSDLRGMPVVLNFWASWCGPCKMEMPEFQKVWQELGTQVQFMMVNLTDGTGETVEGVTQFIGEQGYSFPVYFDTLSEGAMAYGVSSIPATYFIDGEGRLVAYGMGALDEESLRRGIEMIGG